MLTYPAYPALEKLRHGEVLELDGLRLVMDEGEILPGNLYVAGRNTGPHLLTAKEIVYGCSTTECCGSCGLVIPTTNHYAFLVRESVKVREAE